MIGSGSTDKDKFLGLCQFCGDHIQAHSQDFPRVGVDGLMMCNGLVVGGQYIYIYIYIYIWTSVVIVQPKS